MTGGRVGWHVAPDAVEAAGPDGAFLRREIPLGEGDWTTLAHELEALERELGPPAAIAVSGPGLHCFRPRSVLPISPPGRMTTEADVSELLDPLRHPLVEPDRTLLWSGSFRYEVDRRPSADRPSGVSAELLGAEAVVTTYPRVWLRAIGQALGTLGIDVEFVPAGLAALHGSLDEDRRILGGAAIAIGARATEIGVVVAGRAVDFATIPVGRLDLLDGVAAAFRAEPEEIVAMFASGAAVVGEPEGEPTLRQRGAAEPRPVPAEIVRKVAEPRVRALGDSVRQRLIRAAAWSDLAGGVTISGGPSWRGTEWLFAHAVPELRTEWRPDDSAAIARGAAHFGVRPEETPATAKATGWRRVWAGFAAR